MFTYNNNITYLPTYSKISEQFSMMLVLNKRQKNTVLGKIARPLYFSIL